MGEKFGRDPIWENHLATEVWHTEVGLQAVLDEVTVTLNDVVNWRVGSRLQLQATPESLISLHCVGFPGSCLAVCQYTPLLRLSSQP